MGPDAVILVFWMLSFKPAFYSSFTFIKRLLQHHSSKVSILQHSAFFMVQFSHPYMTTGKTIALTKWIFVGKVMSLLLVCCLGWSFSFLCSFSSKEQASFNFIATVTVCSDLGDQENKICHCFYCFLIYFPWNDGTGCMILVFWTLRVFCSFFKPAYSLSFFTFIQRLFSSFHFLS